MFDVELAWKLQHVEDGIESPADLPFQTVDIGASVYCHCLNLNEWCPRLIKLELVKVNSLSLTSKIQ